jgi:hypothetical protein
LSISFLLFLNTSELFFILEFANNYQEVSNNREALKTTFFWQLKAQGQKRHRQMKQVSCAEPHAADEAGNFACPAWAH